MSGKRAKEQRNAIISEVKISVYANGAVQVSNFPKNLVAAMNVMNAGITTIAKHFATQAKEGNVDENFNLEQSRIIKPKMQVTLH